MIISIIIIVIVIITKCNKSRLTGRSSRSGWRCLSNSSRLPTAPRARPTAGVICPGKWSRAWSCCATGQWCPA